MPPPDFGSRSLRRLSTWLVGALAVVTIAQVVRLFAAGAAARTGRALADGIMAEETFESDLGPLLAAELVVSLGQLVVVGLSIAWLWRLLVLRRDAGATSRWTPGWAAGAWFTPPLVYVVPALILDDTWHGVGGRRRNPLVWLWFVVYSVSSASVVVLSVAGDGWAPLNRDDRPLAAYGAALADHHWLIVGDATAAIVAAALWAILTRTLTTAVSPRRLPKR